MQRIWKRTFAEVSSQKLIVNLTVPHATLLKKSPATQVNISSTDGDMGILADHVPSVSQLKPGILEIISSGSSKKYFLSGGFAVMNPDSSLNINAIEAVTLDEVDMESVRKALDEANRVISSGAKPEEKMEARISLEVYNALIAAQK